MHLNLLLARSRRRTRYDAIHFCPRNPEIGGMQESQIGGGADCIFFILKCCFNF